jgi:hypothetical protein
MQPCWSYAVSTPSTLCAHNSPSNPRLGEVSHAGIRREVRFYLHAQLLVRLPGQGSQFCLVRLGVSAGQCHTSGYTWRFGLRWTSRTRPSRTNAALTI